MVNSVTAVVVSYNRKKLLKNCLEGLLSQTLPINKIIIVDNASTDGTKDFLSLEGYLSHPAIEYLELLTNSGGAGGFHEGIKRACESGSEWIWLMDDDVMPLPEGLENLWLYRNASKCIHGSRKYLNGENYIWGGEFHYKNLKVTPKFLAGNEYQQVSVGCFEGMLIHRSIVEKIGFPDSRFFMMGDDTVYGYLASHYTPVFLVKATSLIKQINKPVVIFGNKTLVNNSPLHAYLYTRNQFLIRENLKKVQEKTFTNGLHALLHCIKAIFVYGIYYRNMRQTKLSILGTWHGITKQFNKHHEILFRSSH